MQCSALRSINPPVIRISCQAGGSWIKRQPTPFALNYFSLVVWKRLWILPNASSIGKTKVGKKPNGEKKKSRERKNQARDLHRTIRAPYNTNKNLEWSHFFFLFFFLSPRCCYFSFVIVFLRFHWTEKTCLRLFSTQMAANFTFKSLTC